VPEGETQSLSAAKAKAARWRDSQKTLFYASPTFDCKAVEQSWQARLGAFIVVTVFSVIVSWPIS